MLSLSKHSIIYITRDIERALGLALSTAEGLDLNTSGYFIISNFTPFAKGAANDNKNVLLIKENGLLDTWELLQRLVHSEKAPRGADEESFEVYIGGKKIDRNKYNKQWFKRFLTPRASSGIRNERILVFKNTLQIEKTCKENGWKLLNPPAELSNKVEEKISQIKYLDALKKYLPDYKVMKCKDIDLKKMQANYFFRCEDVCGERSGMTPQREKNCLPNFFRSIVLQFNRSHTGSGTILIKNEKQLKEIQKKFPERECRIAPYIPGPLFTNNNVVGKDNILLGNISYQITGLKPFTDLPFSTIGNDWALPYKYLTTQQIKQYQKIARDVGKKLQKSGWRGLFGIDVVVDERTGKLFLLEINCRQPASTTYESVLQQGIRNKEKGISQIGQSPYSLLFTPYSLTTFEAHLLALQNQSLKKYELIKIKDGAQVILRNTKAQKHKSTKAQKTLKKNGFNVIEYNNTEPNSDLLRIQSKSGIMMKHNGFNVVGKKIKNQI